MLLIMLRRLSLRAISFLIIIFFSSSEQDSDEQGCSLDLMCGIASLTSATTLITSNEPQGLAEGDMVRWRKIAPDGNLELKIGMVTKVV